MRHPRARWLNMDWCGSGSTRMLIFYHRHTATWQQTHPQAHYFGKYNANIQTKVEAVTRTFPQHGSTGTTLVTTNTILPNQRTRGRTSHGGKPYNLQSDIQRAQKRQNRLRMINRVRWSNWDVNQLNHSENGSKGKSRTCWTGLWWCG